MKPLLRISFSVVLFASAILPTWAAFAQSVSDFMHAAYSGDLSEIKSLIAQGVDVNARDGTDSTALMLAASNGHVEVVRELVAKGAEIDLHNRYGWTPLMLATVNDHTDIVRILLARGADASVANLQLSNASTDERNIDFPELVAAFKNKLEAIPRPKPAPKPTPKKSKSPAKKKNNRVSEINRLLVSAERYLRARRVTMPASGNAYSTFRRVLKIDPKNTQAKDGLKRIGAFYQQQAEQSMSSRNYQEGLNFAETGLKIFPTDPGLLRIQAAAKAQLAVQQRVAPAKKNLRQKVEELEAYEEKQREQEHAMRQSMQNLLQQNLVEQERPAEN